MAKHVYHLPSVQRSIMASEDRELIIDWLQWNDDDGLYSDDDRASEGWSPLTLQEAAAAMQCELSEG